MERWADIPGFPPYQVSDCGNVRRVRPNGLPRGGGNLCPSIHEGYRIFRLSIKAQHTYLRAARLVLSAFVGPPPTAAHQAAHWNGSPADDRLSNLRWATPVENNADKVRHQTVLQGESHPSAKLSEMEVRLVKQRLIAGQGSTRIAAELNLPYRAITHIAAGASWCHVQ